MKKMAKIIPLLFYSLLNSDLSYANPSAINSLPFMIEEATIHSVHEAIKNGQITCTQLVNAYLQRIKKYNLSVNASAPLNALTEINSSAIHYARHLDNVYAKTHQLSGPLHCIPVVIKDNVDTYDLTTTSGSLALLGNQPIKDAFLVARLRQAGAIILGKGSMDELASGLSGVSSRSGRTGNAYDPSQNAGGSSSGPAVAVSANFTMAGIGTDNSGSVRVPAAFNGIVGLRPSTGLISQNGIFPRGNMDGIAGPLTRTVEDLALLLDVIAQPDPNDIKTLNLPRPKTYLIFLNENGLLNKRIGIVRRIGKQDALKNMPQEIKQELEKSVTKMQQLGATIVPEINLPEFDDNRKNNEAGEREEVNQYLDSYPATRKNYRDICESDRTRNFGSVEECLKFINTLPKKSSREYEKVLAIFQKNKIYVEKIMEQNHLDALLIPVSTQGSATYDSATIHNELVSSNAGLPAITINAGYALSNNMPIGMELIGRQYAEGTLIEIAYAFQKHASARIVPVLPPANELTATFTTTKLNNLFTLLGYESYQLVLKNGKQEDLTPEVFKRITVRTIDKFRKI